MIRVLLLCNSEDDGGAARSVALLARDLPRDRIAATVAVHREGPLTARLTVPYHVVPELVETPTRPRGDGWPPLLGNSADLVRAVVRLRALSHQADLVYGHTTWSNLCAAAAAPRRAVWHIRNDHSQRAVRAGMLAAARLLGVRGVIAVSQAAAAPYRPLGRRVEVVPNGVDLPAITAARAQPLLRRQHAVAPGEILVGMAGRLVPHKGLSVLIEAARRVRGVRFVVIGGNPRHLAADPMAELRARMPPGTILTGWVAEPERYLADLDILVVPSTYPDPFPRVVIEGLALGLPVVASRIGGIPEAVREGREGFLVPPGDALALADRISALAQNPELRRGMAERARARALARYTSTRTAERVAALLERYSGVELTSTKGDDHHRYKDSVQ